LLEKRFIIINYLKLPVAKRNKKYKIGLVLSGGGAKGFAHVGALKALNEAGIFPDVISGVSAGAIAGALYADHHSPEEIMLLFSERKIYKYIEFIIPKRGLLKMTGLTKIISRSLRSKTFKDLSIPLFVAATDLNNGKSVYFNKGDLLKSVLASATVPVLFPPMKIEDTVYVDGGVLNNFPVDPIENKCSYILGIHVNPFGYLEEFNSIISVAERSFHLSFSTHLNSRKKKCDIFIEPSGLEKYRLMDVSKIEDIYKLGYMETKRILSENKELVAAMLLE
jgi:NTE family protein